MIIRPMNLIRPRMYIPKVLGENYSDKDLVQALIQGV